MRKIIFIVFIVLLRSQTGFNVVASNEIGDMSIFTFEDFQDMVNEGNYYISTFKDETFKVDFKAKLKVIETTSSRVVFKGIIID